MPDTPTPAVMRAAKAIADDIFGNGRAATPDLHIATVIDRETGLPELAACLTEFHEVLVNMGNSSDVRIPADWAFVLVAIDIRARAALAKYRGTP